MLIFQFIVSALKANAYMSKNTCCWVLFQSSADRVGIFEKKTQQSN